MKVNLNSDRTIKNKVKVPFKKGECIKSNINRNAI